MNDSPDRTRVRRAARTVGWTVGIACAVVTILGALALIGTIVLGSHTEGGESHGGPPSGSFVSPSGDQHWVIDSWRLIAAVAVLAVVGVALLSVVAWLAARRAVAPLADALRTQRNFVADASHELRTPLTVLDARIQLLQRRLERGEAVDETVEQLRGDAAAMNEVLGDLLLAAEQSERGGPGEAPVATTVLAAADSLRPLADAAHVSIATRVESAPPTAAITEAALARCVVALVDNAIQHSPPGTTVEVSAAAERGDAVVRVRDQGGGIHGIAPSEVFERFAHGPEQGRRRGFGLGLSLVRDVATRFGGSVEVESTGASGTCFALRLPVAG